jgi:hypothetical protein
MIWKSGGPWGLGLERLDNNIDLQMIVSSGHSIHISKYKVQGCMVANGWKELQLQAMVSLFYKTHATTLFIIVVIMFLTYCLFTCVCILFLSSIHFLHMCNVFLILHPIISYV